MDDLGISPERKIEIDNILKETQEKYKKGEIKAHSLEEFMNEQKIKRREIISKTILKNEGGENNYEAGIGKQAGREV